MSLTFLRGQVGYMKERGFELHALSSPGEDLYAFAEREGVEVYASEMPRRITPLRDLAAVRAIARVVRFVQPSIVHAHTPKGGLLGMMGAALARVPVRIYHMRGLPLMTASGPKRLLLRWTEKIACWLAHQVLCNSHSMREAAVAEGVCPPDKIKVLLGGSGNGVDASGRFNPARLAASTRNEVRARFAIPDNATVIGFVGRMVRDKGVVELATAWQRIRERFPTAHLLMVGPFEPQDPVPAEVELTLRSDPRVHLVGMDWDTPPLYAAMDLVALPTYREGFPNVPLEAAAMELPVVATDIPGCVDAVGRGETGLLVPARDADALASALELYLAEADLRRRHGLAGRDRVLCEFRQEAIWEAIYDEYVRLLREKSLPEPLYKDTVATVAT